MKTMVDIDTVVGMTETTLATLFGSVRKSRASRRHQSLGSGSQDWRD